MCQLSEYMQDNLPKLNKHLNLGGMEIYEAACIIANTVRYKKPKKGQEAKEYNEGLIEHLEKWKHLEDIWIL